MTSSVCNNFDTHDIDIYHVEAPLLNERALCSDHHEVISEDLP
jgi:hypothetical protein